MRKLIVQLYGETGGVTGEYYFSDAKLRFYYTLEESYNSSIGVPGNKVVSEKEERFYFSGGKLIHGKGCLENITNGCVFQQRKEIMAGLLAYLSSQ